MLKPNEDLMESRGITGERKALLEDVYADMDALLRRPEMFSDSPKNAVEVCRRLESQMQRLWGFPQDPNWFRYEFEIKGCTCPAVDNGEFVGTPYRYFNLECPIHNGEEW